MTYKYGLGNSFELEELRYVHNKFVVTYSDKDIDREVHDTVIYIHSHYRDAQEAFYEFGCSLYGAGMITHSQMKIEVEGLRFLFKYRDKVLQGALRGYDKRNTLIINRGGL